MTDKNATGSDAVDLDKSRAEFEEWASRNLRHWTARASNGTYYASPMDTAWSVWQAAQAAMIAQARAAAPAASGEPSKLQQALTTGIPLQEPVYIAKALLAQFEARVSLAAGTGPIAAVFLVNIQITPWTHTKETAEAYAEGYNRALKDYRAALLDLATLSEQPVQAAGLTAENLWEIHGALRTMGKVALSHKVADAAKAAAPVAQAKAALDANPIPMPKPGTIA